MAEVKNAHESVNCLNANEYQTLLSDPRLNPRFITVDSARRRKMYQDDYKRKQAEEEFSGPSEKFLASLNMKFSISDTQEGRFEAGRGAYRKDQSVECYR